LIHKLVPKKWSGKRWLNAALAVAVVVSGWSLTPASGVSAAGGSATAQVDPGKTYVSLKNADFGASNPLVGASITAPEPVDPPGDKLSQLGSKTAGGLQYNYGKSSGSYNATQRGQLGFQGDRVRLAMESGSAFGSLFNKETVTLTDNRSFSTYFSFKMHAGSLADGIVFVVQTASNEAGAVGGGLGYSGVDKSFGVEYDTWRNTGNDGSDPDNPTRNDPKPYGTKTPEDPNTTQNRASHVALNLNGSVSHQAPQAEGKDIANLDIKKMSFAQTSTEASADPYLKFHSWIDYNGLTNKFQTYLVRENNANSFLAPVVKADGTVQTSGSGAGSQVDTVELSEFPHLNATGKLVAPLKNGEGEYVIKPILSDTRDLGGLLLQDDAYIGFTAATGGSTQNHDIFSWYFNNYSGLIIPGTGTPQEAEQAPTGITILNKLPLTVGGVNYDFVKDAGYENLPKGNVPVVGGPTAATGIKAAGSKAEVQAEVKTISGDKISGYPVTFSMYYVESYSTVKIGSGRTVSASKQVDDEDVYLTAEGYTVKTRKFERNGEQVTIREITVPTDENGIATVNLWNLGDYPHITNVKARIGGQLEDDLYGGGNSDSAPVLFAEAIAPKVEAAEVGPDRHTIITRLDTPVEYDENKSGGFTIKVGNKDIPLKVVGHGKDKYGEEDPFVLVLEIDPDSPAFPTDLPREYVIPPTVTPPLSYKKSESNDDDGGSVKGVSGLPLNNFPDGAVGAIPVGNRFAPDSLTVINDQIRNTIEVDFPENVVVPADALKGFTVTINDGVNPALPIELHTGNASILPGATPDKMQLVITDSSLLSTWAGRIPLNAEISLTYEPTKLDPSELIKKAGDASELDRFVNDPVKNQMKPIQAAVIHDTTRDKVRVVFPQPLDATSVTNSVYAYSFLLDGVADPLKASNVVVDSGDATGKTVIFTFVEGLPEGGIPILPFENAPTNIKMNYATGSVNPLDPTQTPIDVRESGPNGRSLGWLTNFTVDNQLLFSPDVAAVGTDPNQIIVSFPANVAVIGQPSLSVMIDGIPGTVQATVVTGSGTDRLTLELAGGVEAPRGAQVKLYYLPSGGNIVDAGDPLRELRPLGPTSGISGDFPVANVFVTIATPANGWAGSKPVTSVTGTSEPGSTLAITVKDSQNVAVPGSVVTDPGTGDWTWTPTTPISSNGQYTVTAVAAGKLNTSATATSVFTMDSSIPMGGGIDLTATPLRNVGDGDSTTKLTATVTDSNGEPVNGAKVVFEVPSAGGQLVDANGVPLPTPEAYTDAEGKAIIYYESPDLTGQTLPQEIVVKASVFDVAHEVSGSKEFTIYFEPPKLKGKITETDDAGVVKPVAGKVVTIRGQNGDIVGTVETNENGEYEFLIPSKQTYTIEYSKTVSGGESITYKQKASIDKPLKGDGTDEFTANKAVAGVLGSKDASGSLNLIDFAAVRGTPNSPNFVAFLKKGNEYVNAADPSGTLLATPAEVDGFAIDQHGLFVADGLPQENDTYKLEIRYYYDVLDGSGHVVERKYLVINVKRNGDLPTVTVQASGELNINEELIDPEGDIRNSVTGGLINDRKVTVKLWYADTARNAGKGVTPGPVVTLPLMPGFPPANNANPTQEVTGGSYAWMVFGDTDYYITAEADGYYSYDSRYDTSAHLESSIHTENGKVAIRVNQTLVRFDFAMTPRSSNSSGPGGIVAPPKKEDPKPSEGTNHGEFIVNVQTDRSIHPETGEGKVEILYKNLSDKDRQEGQIRLILPAGVTVVDADGGTVLAGAIVWDVKNVKANGSGSFQVVLKWPQLNNAEKERSLTLKVEGIAPDASQSASSLKLLAYSNRAGNLKHQRYILGYPDGTFKSERQLLRSELAAIVARLIGEYGTEAKPYSDVPKNYWAADYINTVTKHKIFEGGSDGKFRPNDPVSRGELATVMVRYLQLETGKPIELHYKDVGAQHWAAPAIESLFRNGMISGYPDGTFKPANGIIRSEAVTLINRMLYRGPLTEVEQTWPDIAPSFWAFGQVEEASVSHESTRAEANGKTVEVFVKKLDDEVK